MLNKKLLGIISLSCIVSLIHCSDPVNTGKSVAEFSYWTVGSSGISSRFGTNIYRTFDSLRESTGQLDEFLFAIAEEPVTADQIRERSGLSQAQVEYFITVFDSLRFIKKHDESRWATVLPVITDNRMKIIRKDLASMAESVAQYLKEEGSRIRTLYDKVKSPLDPSWENISHLIIDKFIVDGSFHSNLNRLKRESDSGKPGYREMNVIPAFLLQQGENFVNFGCNWYKFNEDDDQREVYVLHGAVLDRYQITMNKYRGNRDFAACLLNVSPKGEINNLTQLEKEMLRGLDWIPGDSLMVPIVKAGTIISLQPTVEDIGRAAAEVAYAKISDITDSYNRSSYSKFIQYKEDYIQVLIHSLFGLTIEQLVKNGTVAKIPILVPESFGVFIVNGKLY